MVLVGFMLFVCSPPCLFNVCFLIALFACFCVLLGFCRLVVFVLFCCVVCVFVCLGVGGVWLFCCCFFVVLRLVLFVWFMVCFGIVVVACVCFCVVGLLLFVLVISCLLLFSSFVVFLFRPFGVCCIVCVFVWLGLVVVPHGFVDCVWVVLLFVCRCVCVVGLSLFVVCVFSCGQFFVFVFCCLACSCF